MMFTTILSRSTEHGAICVGIKFPHAAQHACKCTLLQLLSLQIAGAQAAELLQAPLARTIDHGHVHCRHKEHWPCFGGHMQDLMQISSIELAASLPEDLLHRLQAQSCAANSSF